MKKKSKKNNPPPKDVNISLSKSGVPTDLSKYPRVTVTGENKKDANEIQKNSDNQKQNQKKRQRQDTVNLSLSKSSVPTDFSKYPTVTVSREEKKEGDKQTLPGPEKHNQTQEKNTKKDAVNLSLSKSEVPTDFSKYPTVTVSRAEEERQSASDSTIDLSQNQLAPREELTTREKPPTPTASTKAGEGRHEKTLNETVQLKKELKVALRKSHKALDLSKYPKVVVTDEEEDEDESPAAKSKPENIEKKLPSEEKPSLKRETTKSTSKTDSIATQINETVQLKKGLKVALRKSAKALDVTKYQKVTVSSDANAKKPSSDSASAETPKVKFADHVKDDNANDTVQLMKNLKLSLSKSAKAIDLKKYPKITVDADLPEQSGISEAKEQKEQRVEKEAAPPPRAKEPQELAAKQKTEQEQIKVQESQPKQEKADIKEKEDRNKIPPSTAEPSIKPESVKKPKRILSPTSTPIPKIMDPTRRRDNATVKLGAPQPNLAQMDELKTDDVGEPASDTVVLKVIKEKKKKLAGILSASQTIRLQPSSEPGFTPAGPVPPATEPAIPKKTLKLKTPGSAEEKDKEAPQTLERRVLKLKPSIPVADKGEEALPSEGEQTTVRRSQRRPERVATPTAKATLKIKVPASDAEAKTTKSPRERQQKATLKIKAPPSAAAVSQTSAPVSQAPRPGIEVRGKQIAPPAATTSGKTLKLKAVPRAEPQQAASAVAGAPNEKVQAKRQVEQPSESLNFETDVFYTISAAASLCVIGVALYLMVSQFNSLF